MGGRVGGEYRDEKIIIGEAIENGGGQGWRRISGREDNVGRCLKPFKYLE